MEPENNIYRLLATTVQMSIVELIEFMQIKISKTI